jgi:hypothetical protein
MKFFISAELFHDISESYREIALIVEEKLNNNLGNKNYGNSIESIGVIPIILPESWLLDRKERRLIQRKAKKADYRLFISYNKFKENKKEIRIILLINNIVEIILDIKRKIKKDFEADMLIADILKVFNIKWNTLENNK